MDSSGKKLQALLIFAVLALLLSYALHPYSSAFLGAFILYVLFKPLYRYLVIRRRIGPLVSAIMVIFISLLAILVPMYVFFTLTLIQIQVLVQDLGWVSILMDAIIHYMNSFNELSADLLDTDILSVKIDLSLQGRLMQLITSLTSYLSGMAMSTMSSIGQSLLNAVIMYFVFFYLLTEDSSEFAQKARMAIPFNEENTQKLLSEFSSLVKTLFFNCGLVALIQGLLLTLSFLVLGIKGAIMWGFLTMLLSFLSAKGAPVVWIPVMLLRLITGDMLTAIGILITGIVLAILGKVLRAGIKEITGEVHPLTLFVGVVSGMKLFGLSGVFIGPMLISYVVLVARMIQEEFLIERDATYLMNKQEDSEKHG